MVISQFFAVTKQIFLTSINFIIFGGFLNNSLLVQENLKLKKELQELKTKFMPVEQKPFPEKVAEKIISDYIEKKKKSNIRVVSDLEIMEKFDIPIDQVNKIMDKFLKEGKVHEKPRS